MLSLDLKLEKEEKIKPKVSRRKKLMIKVETKEKQKIIEMKSWLFEKTSDINYFMPVCQMDEMGRFLKRHKIPALTQEEIT